MKRDFETHQNSSLTFVEISPLLENSIQILLQAIDGVVHTQNFTQDQCIEPPEDRLHVFKTEDPVLWYKFMFNRSIEQKTQNGLRSEEIEYALKPSKADEYRDVAAEMIDRRIRAEEQENINNIRDRADMHRIHGADRNNNVFLRLRDRFGEYILTVVRDQVLEQMAREFPEDYPNGSQQQPELMNRSRREENGNDEF